MALLPFTLTPNVPCLHLQLTALKAAAAVKRPDLPRIGSPLRAGASPLALNTMLSDRDSHRRGGGSVDSPLSQVLKTRNDGGSRSTRTVSAEGNDVLK